MEWQIKHWLGQIKGNPDIWEDTTVKTIPYEHPLQLKDKPWETTPDLTPQAKVKINDTTTFAWNTYEHILILDYMLSKCLLTLYEHQLKPKDKPRGETKDLYIQAKCMNLYVPRSPAKIKPEGHFLSVLNSAAVENHLIALKQEKITKLSLVVATEVILREFEKVDFYIDPLDPSVLKLPFWRAKSIVQEAKTLKPGGERNDNFFFGKLYLALAVCSIINLKRRHGPGSKHKEALRHYVDKAFDMLEQCAVTVDFLRLMILFTKANTYFEKLYEYGLMMVSQRRDNFESACRQLGEISPLLLSIRKSLEYNDSIDLGNLHVTLTIIDACQRIYSDVEFLKNNKAEDVIMQPLKSFLERSQHSDSNGETSPENDDSTRQKFSFLENAQRDEMPTQTTDSSELSDYHTKSENDDTGRRMASANREKKSTETKDLSELSDASSDYPLTKSVDSSRPKLLLRKCKKDRRSRKKFDKPEDTDEEDAELTQKYIAFIRLTDGKLPSCFQRADMNTKERKIEIYSSDTHSSEHRQFLELIKYENEKEWYVVKQHDRVQLLTLQPLAAPVNPYEISVYAQVNPGSAFIAKKKIKEQETINYDPKECFKDKSGDSNFWTIGFLGNNSGAGKEIYLVSCGHGFDQLDKANHTWEYFSVYQPMENGDQKPSLLKIDSNQGGLVIYHGTYDKNKFDIPYLVDISLLPLNQGFLGNTNVDLHFRENFKRQGKILEMEVYSGDMRKLRGKRVFCRGCKSGHHNETAEIIHGVVGAMNFNGRLVTGLFSIALCNSQKGVGTHGDSGALVYGFIDNKPMAIGLIYAGDEERKAPTYCIPLQHAQRYLKEKHDIHLCFYYNDDWSGNDSGISSTNASPLSNKTPAELTNTSVPKLRNCKTARKQRQRYHSISGLDSERTESEVQRYSWSESLDSLDNLEF